MTIVRSWFPRTPSGYRGPNGPCSLRARRIENPPRAQAPKDSEGIELGPGGFLYSREAALRGIRCGVPGCPTSAGVFDKQPLRDIPLSSILVFAFWGPSAGPQPKGTSTRREMLAHALFFPTGTVI